MNPVTSHTVPASATSMSPTAVAVLPATTFVVSTRAPSYACMTPRPESPTVMELLCRHKACGPTIVARPSPVAV